MSRLKGRRRMERRIIECLNQGNSVREIMRKLKVGDRRVRQVRELARSYGYLDCRPVPPFPEAVFPEDESERIYTSEADQLLLGHREWVKERLKARWSPITVFEELPVKVSRSSFYRFLTRHGLDRIGEKTRRRLTPEIVHTPGECLQLDWGKFREVIDPKTGKKRILWAFVGVLGFSRYMMVRLVWSNDIPTTLAAIESMFSEMGGVPEKITSDNPKCFALEASKYEPLLNPIFERFANHYGCTVELLPPYDPEKKGKVERMMPYVRRLNEAHGPAWHGLEEQQEYINRKVDIANQRRHGTTQLKPLWVFKEKEQEALKDLPALSYEIEEFADAKVRKDGFVRFANKYYAVGTDYHKKEVTIIGNKSHVSIYQNGKLIEVYERLTDPSRSKAFKPHHLKPHEQVMQDNAFYIKRAEKIGPHLAKLVEAILLQGQGFVDTRRVWGLLSLDKSYDKKKIDEAAKHAFSMGALSYRTVKSLIVLTAQTEAPKVAERPKAKNKCSKSESPEGTHKFTRNTNEYTQFVNQTHNNKEKNYDSQCNHRPAQIAAASHSSN